MGRMLAATGISGWFAFNAIMAFYTYLARNSPEQPDFPQGRVAPMFQHDRIFYVEPWQKGLAYYGLALSLSLVVVAALVALFFRRRLISQPALSWLNGWALVIFLAWIAYASWPLPS